MDVHIFNILLELFMNFLMLGKVEIIRYQKLQRHSHVQLPNTHLDKFFFTKLTAVTFLLWTYQLLKLSTMLYFCTYCIYRLHSFKLLFTFKEFSKVRKNIIIYLLTDTKRNFLGFCLHKPALWNIISGVSTG